jgi:ribosomal protein S18 acetylase RimI-like enzyme
MDSVLSRFQVRPATLRDAQAVAEVHVAAWQAAYAGVLPPEHLNTLSVDKRTAYWRQAIDHGEPQMLVATEGARVVGFVGFDRSRDKGTKQTVGEIWTIAAHPDVWDCGVGLALWDAARDGLQDEGCTKVSIWLPLRSPRALRFHELAGFKREIASAKTVEVGGVRLEEIRLSRSIA